MNHAPGGIAFHTRHIPVEHLKESSVDAYDSRIMITLTPENLALLKDRGVGTIELRLAWWEIEPAPGRFDWSRFDRDLDAVERRGFKAGLMAWFNHPPDWYRGHEGRAGFFTCLDHGRETTTLSPWDPRFMEIMERLYALTADRYGRRIDFVYLTSCGDYGEPVPPQGVSAYRFSSPHSHGGVFWAGDPHARAAWRARLERRYGDIARLNAAWGASFGSWEDDLFTGLTTDANPPRRLDYMRWLLDSMADCAAGVHRVVKRHFPHARTAVPIGSVDEAMCGQSKSLCVKRLAEVSADFTARWTGMAYLGEFSSSNVLARRLSSIARFYGVGYGEETAFDVIDPGVAMYECLANGASMIHDDLASIRRGELADLFGRLVVDPPVCDAAVYYPLESEMLESFDPRCPKLFTQCGGAFPLDASCDRGCLARFFAAAARLRAVTDYEICDSLMIADGFLDGVSVLIFVHSTVVPADVIPALEAFAARGGRIVLADNAVVTVLESGARLDALLPHGVERAPGLPRFPAFERLRRADGELITVHGERISRYHPDRKDFTIEPR